MQCHAFNVSALNLSVQKHQIGVAIALPYTHAHFQTTDGCSSVFVFCSVFLVCMLLLVLENESFILSLSIHGDRSYETIPYSWTDLCAIRIYVLILPHDQKYWIVIYSMSCIVNFKLNHFAKHIDFF